VSLARGRQWEAQATAELLFLGWTILETNFYGGGGEIDIVAIRNGCLWFVEVKGREWLDERALESIGPKKKTLLAKAAAAYLQQTDLSYDSCCFVLCLADGQSLDWWEDAFEGGME
jgi:putative endonuclease